jgi:hypothetical protein
MPSPTACETEIAELHDLFARWYRGEAERGEFERLERALADSFELVSPDGQVNNRESIVAGIRSAYDSKAGFDIEIRNVEPVRADGDRALVRYEEWQTRPTGDDTARTGRLSTALFESVGDDSGTPSSREDTRPAARWLYLHETWLEGPEA